jgi:hypothetical protein
VRGAHKEIMEVPQGGWSVTEFKSRLYPPARGQQGLSRDITQDGIGLRGSVGVDDGLPQRQHAVVVTENVERRVDGARCWHRPVF